MRIIHYFIVVMGLVVGLAGSNNSLVSAKTLEAGYASTSWMGIGEVHDLPDGGQVINAIVKGVMIVRHSNGEVGGIVHTAQLECPIRVTLNKADDHRGYFGLCTILAHEGKDVGYAAWKCANLPLQAGPVDLVESREQRRSSAGLSSRSWKQATLEPSAMRIGRT